MTFIVCMAVVQFFGGWFAQADHLHVELQFRACERVIEVKANGFVVKTLHECELSLPVFISDI